MWTTKTYYLFLWCLIPLINILLPAIALEDSEHIRQFKKDATILSSNLTWVFVKDDMEFYMKNETAIESYQLRGKFQARVEASDTISIQLESNGNYLTIGPNDQLELTSLHANRSYFARIPIAGRNVFYLYAYVNGLYEPLVTSKPRPTFTFHLKRRYPNERPAEFSFIGDLDVGELYKGNRSNIENIVTIIDTSPTTNKTAGFEKLVELMEYYDHINGKEIFLVAHYIYIDLSVRSAVFMKLPLQVQLLVSKIDLGLYFLPTINDINITIPLKYEYASDLHQRILPYTFTFNATTKYWAITYAEAHQFYIASNSNANPPPSPLIERQTNELYDIFVIYLNYDLQTFRISANIRLNNQGIYRLFTTNTSPDYYFQCVYTNNPLPSIYAVAEFVSN